MQFNSINAKEQTELSNNSFKATTNNSNADFLSYLNSSETTSYDYSKNNHKEKISVDKHESIQEKNKTEEKEKPVKEKKDTTETNKEAEKTSEKEEDNETAEIVATVQQTEETGKTTPKETNQKISYTEKTTPSQNSPINNNNEEVFAAPKDSEVEILNKNQPETNKSTQQSTTSLLETSETTTENFKNVLNTLKNSDTKTTITKNATNQVEHNTKTETNIVPAKDEQTLQQAEILATKLGKDIKNPIKISVENIDTTEAHLQNSTSQTLVSINNAQKTEQVQNKQTAKKLNNNISEQMQEISEKFSSAFSSIAKSARETILGKTTTSVQSKEIKLDTNEIGIASQSTEATKPTTSSDSEFLLLNKTYNTGKAVGTKNTAPVTKQQPVAAKQVIDQIKVQIKQSNISDKITVKLNPKELGQVELKIEASKSGSMNIEITANKKETLELLKQDIKYLEKALQETVTKSETPPNFSFNLKEDNSSYDEQQQNAQRQENKNNKNNNNTSLPQETTQETEQAEYHRQGISIKV